MGSLVIVLLDVSSWFWQWNNFENRLTFDEVKAYQKHCAFLGHPVCVCCVFCSGFAVSFICEKISNTQSGVWCECIQCQTRAFVSTSFPSSQRSYLDGLWQLTRLRLLGRAADFWEFCLVSGLKWFKVTEQSSLLSRIWNIQVVWIRILNTGIYFVFWIWHTCKFRVGHKRWTILNSL